MSLPAGRFAALIFDVDGTLAETEETHRRAFNETFAYFKLGWDWPPLLYRRLLRVTGGKERIAAFARAPENLGRRHLSADEIAELHRFKTARFGQLVSGGGCPLRPGVASVVERARQRGLRLAIATTTARPNVEALLRAAWGSEADALFDVIVAGDEVPRKKPAPDVYLKVLALLGLEGGDCLAIEDSRAGLLAAGAAGVAVLITRSFYFGDDDFEGAAAVVENLAEAMDIGAMDQENGKIMSSMRSGILNIFEINPSPET
ncbi:HAD-IA family hydrolase [Telmatospirillum siberiense]|uniref:Phosphatase n=1 Tax=Telmatospirillum siberiense TaxID=382514 RepID=A0A2N3PXS3_9PROT|nr:HAD-IA family hydrolase [Telmatospirillum siberiense]PKU25197.1 phosphatase [Telmatospirillum siberiense]